MVMNPDKLRRYTVGVLVSNEPGVLSRVSGLFSRRGFNIESLAVGPTQDREVSRITIVVLGDDAHIEQLVQQLYKLICVQKVQVLSNKNDVERQLLLVKVAAGVKERSCRSYGMCAAVALCMMLVGAIGMKLVPAQAFGIVERFSVFAATGFNAALGIHLFCGKEEAV